MASSFSDMMNEPAMYALGDDSSSSSSNRSASLPMQHNQMMTSPVAPNHHYHMQPPAMPYKPVDPVASQLMHSKQYMAEHVTPAPVVKSQAHSTYFMPSSVTQPTAGFVYNPTTTAPTSPMDYAMLNYNDQYMLQPPVSSPMMVDYQAFHTAMTTPDTTSDIAAAMYNTNAVYHAPPVPAPAQPPPPPVASYTPVVPSNTKMQMVAQPSMMMLMMGEAEQQPQPAKKTVSRRRSTITAKSSPDLQPNQSEAKMKPAVQQQQQQTTGTRRNMPRRHTVSGPYRPSSTAQQKTKEEEKYRKLLKAKRHRSLGKLEMPPGSPVDASKWLSPETTTASSSSSMCSPILSGNSDVFEQDQLLLMDKLGQQPGACAGDAPQDEEEEKYQCLWENCYLEMRTLDELIMHVKDMHIGSGKALYYCGWKDCPRNQKPFTKRHKMHNHLRTHTGERPFECTEPGCGKRFSRPDSLTTHSKIHSNVRPYLCQFENCGKAYYHLRSLRKHERTHEVRYFDGENTMQQESSTGVSHAADNPVASLVPQPGDTALLDWCGTNTSF